jgi:hypothetical protein
MEMDDPILDILETALDLSEMVDMDGDRDQFAEDIEFMLLGILKWRPWVVQRNMMLRG